MRSMLPSDGKLEMHAFRKKAYNIWTILVNEGFFRETEVRWANAKNSREVFPIFQKFKRTGEVPSLKNQVVQFVLSLNNNIAEPFMQTLLLNKTCSVEMSTADFSPLFLSNSSNQLY